jgi:hypothetical protein
MVILKTIMRSSISQFFKKNDSLLKAIAKEENVLSLRP